MRSLGTIRSRVERLASVCLPSPVPLINNLPRAVSVHAVPGLRCGSAGPRAGAGGGPRGSPAGVAHVVEYDELTTCPHCHAALLP